jgi:hypothetical protein
MMRNSGYIKRLTKPIMFLTVGQHFCKNADFRRRISGLLRSSYLLKTGGEN